MDIKKQFGSRIRELRLAKQRSQEDLAAATKLHRTYIGIVERWEKNISLENIRKMADALWISIRKLFDFE